MSDDKVTIRIPQDDFQQAKQAKQEAGQTWAEYLTDSNRGQPNPGEVARELAAELGEAGFMSLKAACVAAIREELTVREYPGERQ